jgi:poly(A) polymerase
MSPINKKIWAGKVVKKLESCGFKAYFVGGCVRDILLDKEPDDIDIATDAEPSDITKIFKNTYLVGKQFGVVNVIQNRIPFEVATFRKDGFYEDGRHPSSVEFGSFDEDAYRRDFTINGMYYHPERDEIIDIVGGKKDLDAGIIRTIGSPEARFNEDKLRLIRAVRFCSNLGYKLDEETKQWIKNLADQISAVSAERIREELIKILTRNNADIALDLLSELGLLAVILPEVEAMKNVPQPQEFHPEGDVFEHTKLMFKLMEERPSIELAFGVLLHDVGKPRTIEFKERIRFDNHTFVGEKIAEKILRRLKFPNKQRELICQLVRDHLKFIEVLNMRVSTLKKFLRQDNFDEHLNLHKLDCLASHGMLDNYYFCLEKLDGFGKEEIRPKPFINGFDLLKMKFTPGPIFSEILKAVEDAQLEKKITSKKEALEFVRENFVKAERLVDEKSSGQI